MLDIALQRDVSRIGPVDPRLAGKFGPPLFKALRLMLRGYRARLEASKM